MYGLIWRMLPGPVWLRVLEAAALLALVVFALFEWGYPWAADRFFGSDPGVS